MSTPPPKIVGEEDKHLFYLIIIQKAMKYNTTTSNKKLNTLYNV